MSFLPINRKEATDRGWEEVDFVYVIGDAYVDHPSFGPAIISRVLEHNGFTVGIISQPDWKDCSAFKEYGRPRLGFFVSSGNIDSMVAHYTASKKKEAMMPILPAVKQEQDLTELLSFTATASGKPTETYPLL